MSDTRHTIAVTALIEYGGKFLFIERPHSENEYKGMWVFPGGRVHADEDIVQGLRRELVEETGVSGHDEICMLSSYRFTRTDGSSTQGIVFLVRTNSEEVVLDPDSASGHAWITPEEIIDYLSDQRTIYGMEVHVRNALLSLRGVRIPPDAYSVSQYQKLGCSMTKSYIKSIRDLSWDPLESFQPEWIFPNPGSRLL